MAKKASKPETNGSETPPGPAYFTSLTLENVRCFREKQTLKLDDGKGGPARWTILLGENGTGKTTVLQALVAMDWSSKPPIPNGPADTNDLWHAMDRGISRLEDFLTLPRGAKAEGILRATFSAANFDQRYPPQPLGSRQLKLWLAGGGIGTHSGRGADEDPSERPRLPLLCAYGASRRLGSATLSAEAVDDPVGTLFSDTASLRHAEETLLQLDYASKSSPEDDRHQRQRDRITGLLLAVLPEDGATAIRFVAGEGTPPKSRVDFETPYGWVPLRSLGHGYQTLIAWMVDLASRMAERYPDSPDPLTEPAIVLVDEIDLHLHPKWQRQLVGELTRRFPQTQFIVTAHSPLVVQAAEDANLAVLRREGDQVVIDNDVDQIRNWRLDQIYTSELFGLPNARPPRLDKLLEQRQAILARPELTAADRRELEELDGQIGPLPGGESAEEAEDRRVIRESLDYLRKGVAGS